MTSFFPKSPMTIQFQDGFLVCMFLASPCCRALETLALSWPHQWLLLSFQLLFLSPKCPNFSRFCPWLFFNQLPSLDRCLPDLHLCFNLFSKVLVPYFQLLALYLHLHIQRARPKTHPPDCSPTSHTIKSPGLLNYTVRSNIHPLPSPNWCPS